MAARFRLHHAPMTRASSIQWLLKEAGADYEIVPHDLAAGTHKRPEFLALNPHGKLPVLEDCGPAADVMLDPALQWFTLWQLLQPTPAIARSMAALTARPASIRARALETT